MAKKGLKQRNKTRKQLIIKYAEQRATLKAQLKVVDGLVERTILYKKLERLPRNSSPVRYRNRCWATGRSGGYVGDFGLSRHVMREMAREGLIPGLGKASW
jgi:small subunit ribosomal protein S14